MPILILEETDSRVHLIRESMRDKKGRQVFRTKCGATVEKDSAHVTGWDSEVTCPECAVPWV